ncbi:MAG: YfhO family protein [Candidatus Roizmanbacteria bacterium]|nr:YfhO family protein [Candidatus Roizmanbacteria bacterium]
MHKNSIYHFLHKYGWDILAIASLIIVFVAFFARLFLPHISMFYIPDSFNSDMFHVNFSQKFYLSSMLKTGHLPFITQQIANGFPLLAESQIGALSIFNILLYRFLDPVMAFNVTYLCGFIGMSIFLYLLGRILYNDRFLAYILAISYSFCGIVILKITHQDILQAIFLLPVVLYLYNRGKLNYDLRFALLAGFTCGQQYLFGQFFVAVGTCISITTIFLHSFITKRNNRQNELYFYVLFTAATVLVSLPQLVQSFIFYMNSTRQNTLSIGMFDLRYVFTLLEPNIFGSLKDGSIFRNSQKLVSATWESNLFLGYAPLLLLMMSKNIKKNFKKVPSIYKVLVLVFAVLMLGNYPIINFIGYLPLLAGFRAHSRFVIFTSLYLIIIILYVVKNGFRFHKAPKKIYIFVAIIAIQLITSFYIFYPLHPVVVKDKLLSAPMTANILKKNTSYYSLNFAKNYYDIFHSKGYTGTSKYIALHTSLYPYSNLIYGGDTCGLFIYSNFNPELYQDLALKISLYLNNENSMTFPQSIKTKLGILGCTHIISSKPLSKTSQKVKDGVYISIIQEQVPRYKLYTSYISSLDEVTLLQQIENSSYDFRKLYVYDTTALPSIRNATGTSRPLIQTDTKLRYSINATTESYFFVRILNYPGWHAYIDDKEVKIERADLLYMSVRMPQGKHTVSFIYSAPFWKESVAASLLFYLVLLLTLIFHKSNPSKSI